MLSSVIMTKINDHYLKLRAGYLFPEIARRTSQYKAAHPDADIIRLGIGDVTRALTPSVLAAFHRGVDDMAKEETFRGYGPEQGYPFLLEKIASQDFKSRGAHVEPDEIFVSDGSKCDTGNIIEIFGEGNVIAVQDPVYPVYVDTNVMAGRTGGCGEAGYYAGLRYLRCTAETDFTAEPPSDKLDLIYLCSPNNPTGAVMPRPLLEKWVAYARKNQSIILFDAAYEAYISDPSIPHSIYEIEGARECAIEFRSFSKNAGFTGVRCAYTVVPKTLHGCDANGISVGINQLWNRLHCTKFNGVSYPVQRAAEAVYSEEGRREVRELIAYYMNNARVIRAGLESAGLKVFGGVNAPYIWLKTPAGIDSWSFFDKFLQEVQVVGTPGSGFGPAGEGYFRLSAFGSADRVKEAIERIKTNLTI